MWKGCRIRILVWMSGCGFTHPGAEMRHPPMRHPCTHSQTRRQVKDRGKSDRVPQPDHGCVVNSRTSGSRGPRESVVGSRVPRPSLGPRLRIGLQVPHPACELEERRPSTGDSVALECAGRQARKSGRLAGGEIGGFVLRWTAHCWPDCGGICAPPSRPKTPGSIDTSGTNERCERNGASSAHAVGFARSEPNRCAWRPGRPAAPAADGAEAVPLANSADRCNDRGRRVAPVELAWGSARMPPVTTRPAKGCGLAQKG